jgi:Mg2+/Co2+ transporter CorC
MTVEEFRRHQHLPIQWRRELRTNGILQLVIEVLQEAHPSRFPVHTDLQDDLSPTKAALQLGETRGYSKCLNTIMSLSNQILPKETPEPTYEPEKA